MLKAMNWSLVAQRTICSATQFAGDRSLHVHVFLWVEAEDVARVADEIIAFVPAMYNEDTHSFVPPSDPLLCSLYTIVMRKHMHSCTHWTGKANGCRDDMDIARCSSHLRFLQHWELLSIPTSCGMYYVDLMSVIAMSSHTTLLLL